MGKYILLQCKRTARVLMWAIPVLAVLVLCLGLGGKALARNQLSQDSRQVFPIGLVGVPKKGMLRVGLSALQSFDDIGMTMELIELTAEEAPEALASGRVKAYAVIPEDFAKEASRGNLLTIQYVTTPDASGITALFQQEVTDIIGDILLQSEKASFGTYDALEPYVDYDRAYDAVNDLSTTLAEFVFVRSRTTVTVELGIGGAPSFGVYLAAGLCVVLVMLLTLCFAPVLVQQNLGVNRMLRARGRSATAQALADFAVALAGQVAAVAVVYCIAGRFVQGLGLGLLGQALGVVCLASAMGYLCFSLVSDIHSGLLLYFFLTMALALVCGCLYPAWFFPVGVQKAAAWLPAGMARRYLTGAITGHASREALLGCLGYSALFVAAGAGLRAKRICK